eukprot:scaffold47193_cov58-Attheya_sp.AAC.11
MPSLSASELVRSMARQSCRWLVWSGIGGCKVRADRPYILPNAWYCILLTECTVQYDRRSLSREIMNLQSTSTTGRENNHKKQLEVVAI